MKNENENVKTAETVNEPEAEASICVPETAEVEKAIRTSVYASMGVGIVPLPLFNVAAATASNLNLARKLSNLYGVEFKEGAAKKVIAAVIGASAGTLATPLVESVVGLVPVIGWPLVIGTKPVLNGMTTYAIGRMFVTHFENGGSFLGANLDAMKENFKAAFKNSREWLGNAISGKKAEPENA